MDNAAWLSTDFLQHFLPSCGADRGRYCATFGLQSLPSPLMGEGSGGGEGIAPLPPVLSFPRQGGRERGPLIPASHASRWRTSLRLRGLRRLRYIRERIVSPLARGCSR